MSIDFFEDPRLFKFLNTHYHVIHLLPNAPFMDDVQIKYFIYFLLFCANGAIKVNINDMFEKHFKT